VDDKAGAERDALRCAIAVAAVTPKWAAAERPRHLLALAAMLVEKAPQEIVERGAAEFLGRLPGRLFGIRFAGHRDVHDRGQYAFDQRREALLRNGDVWRRCRRCRV